MENKILKKINYSIDIKYFSTLTLFTILSCYIIAVLKGDVPIWLPYISDCAVGYPEAYIFRSGMTLSSLFLFLNSYEFYLFSSYYNKNWFPFLSLIYSGISNAGFATLAVVNEKENDHLHILGAVVFFAMQGFYMWNSIICICYINKNAKIKNQINEINNAMDLKFFGVDIDCKDIDGALKIVKKKSKIFSNKSIFCKSLITILYSADVIYLVINEQDEKKSAIYEWLAVIFITIFNFSFILDYGKKLLLGVLLN